MYPFWFCFYDIGWCVCDGVWEGVSALSLCRGKCCRCFEYVCDVCVFVFVLFLLAVFCFYMIYINKNKNKTKQKQQQQLLCIVKPCCAGLLSFFIFFEKCVMFLRESKREKIQNAQLFQKYVQMLHSYCKAIREWLILFTYAR